MKRLLLWLSASALCATGCGNTSQDPAGTGAAGTSSGGSSGGSGAGAVSGATAVVAGSGGRSANGGAANAGGAGIAGSGSAGETAGGAPAQGGSAGTLSGVGGSSGGVGGVGGVGGAPCPDGCPTKNIIQLSAGELHTCALLSDFSVKCWGEGSYGALGYGPLVDIGDDELLSSVGAVPVSSDPLVHVTQIAAGGNTFARLSDGSLKCWGANGLGGCGNGLHDNNGSVSPTPGTALSISTDAGVTVDQVAAGTQHACAILSNGSIKCWGDGEYGALGYGNLDNIGDDELPSAVGAVSVTTEAGVKVTQLALGLRHTCALLSNGSVKCWGWNDSGQLGTGNSNIIGDDELPSSIAPISVSSTPGVKVVQLVAGLVHTCALLSDHSLRCWGGPPAIGAGKPIQIGDDELPSSVDPVSVGAPDGTTVTQVSAGGLDTCVRFSNGTAKCWGDNTLGNLGYGNLTPIGFSETPAALGLISVTTSTATVTSLAASSTGTCALLSDGTGKCWGGGGLGQLGLGYTTNIGDDELPSSINALKLF